MFQLNTICYQVQPKYRGQVTSCWVIGHKGSLAFPQTTQAIANAIGHPLQYDSTIQLWEELRIEARLTAPEMNSLGLHSSTSWP